MTLRKLHICFIQMREREREKEAGEEAFIFSQCLWKPLESFKHGNDVI